MKLPLIVRDKQDEPVRRFRYSDNALRFIARELCFGVKDNVLTLTHANLGLTLAEGVANTSGFRVSITDNSLMEFFR